MLNSPSLRLRIAKWLWGWEPHSTQKQWFLCNAQTKVASCGRRWGKTEAAAVDAATMAIVNIGSIQIIVAPTYDQSRLIFDTVEKLLMDSPVTRPLTKAVRTPYPRLTFCGSLIMARTADEDGRNLRGHSADRVIVDEAAYVRDKVVREVISPMLADRNGKLVMVSTPFGKNHFYRAFVKGREADGNCASFTFPSWTNPHISRDYIERQREELSPVQFAVEYEAQFVDDQASVFDWESIRRAEVRGRNAELGDFDCVVAGVDWARYSDYTVAVALGVRGNDASVIALDRFNGLSWSLQIDRVAQFLKAHGVSEVLTDQTSIGDPLLEQLRSRLWENGADVAVDGMQFTNSSKRELIDSLAIRFAHGTISIPGDEQLIKELQYFECELTPSGNIRMNARSGHHDDTVIALALACKAAKSAGAVGNILGGGGRVAAGGW